MKVFYRTEMSADSGGYSPSAGKPDQVVSDWLSSESLKAEIEIVSDFDPVTIDDIKRVHDSDFVDGIMSLEIANGHGNTSAEVRDTLLWTSGSLYAGCVAALSDGVSCSPTSGFHHSCYDDCHGFCTFNGLMVAAAKVIDEGLAKDVLIVDFDAHWGDGTADILKKFPALLSAVDNLHASDLPASEFLDWIEDVLSLGPRPDLVIYQAGADLHEDDPLHAGYLNSEQMRLRDRLVFKWCKDEGIPVCWNLAGGYQRDEDGGIPKVLDIHRATAEEAIY